MGGSPFRGKHTSHPGGGGILGHNLCRREFRLEFHDYFISTLDFFHFGPRSNFLYSDNVVEAESSEACERVNSRFAKPSFSLIFFSLGTGRGD